MGGIGRRSLARTGAALLMAAVLGAVAACGGGAAPASPGGGKPAAGAAKPSSPGGGAAPAGKAFIIGIPVGVPNLVHIIPYIALDRGYFRQRGVNVKLVRFEGGLQSLKSDVAGSSDLAWTDFTSVVPAYVHGAKDLRVYYSVAPKLDAAIVGDASVKTVADMAHAKVGMSGEIGGFADVLNRLAFLRYGVDYNRVTIIKTTTAGRVAALVSGQTDTGVFHIDQVDRAEAAKPGVHVLAKMWQVAPDWQYSGMAANAQRVAANRQTYEKVIEALIEAARYAYANRAGTLRIAEKYTKEPASALGPAYDDLVQGHVWAVNAGLDPGRYAYTMKLDEKIGNLRGPIPSFSDVVDLSLAKQALQKLGPYRGDSNPGD